MYGSVMHKHRLPTYLVATVVQLPYTSPLDLFGWLTFSSLSTVAASSTERLLPAVVRSDWVWFLESFFAGSSKSGGQSHLDTTQRSTDNTC